MSKLILLQPVATPLISEKFNYFNFSSIDSSNGSPIPEPVTLTIDSLTVGLSFSENGVPENTLQLVGIPQNIYIIPLNPPVNTTDKFTVTAKTNTEEVSFTTFLLKTNDGNSNILIVTPAEWERTEIGAKNMFEVICINNQGAEKKGIIRFSLSGTATGYFIHNGTDVGLSYDIEVNTALLTNEVGIMLTSMGTVQVKIEFIPDNGDMQNSVELFRTYSIY
ncbi:TPA: hypothetical protein ACS78C_003820 [Providencia alcalifaciens]